MKTNHNTEIQRFSLVFVYRELRNKFCSVCFSGLKGQNKSAQGKVSGGTSRNVALGEGKTTKSVRGNMLIKAKNFFRTELHKFIFKKTEIINFVRKKNVSLINIITRTIIIPVNQSQGVALG